MKVKIITKCVRLHNNCQLIIPCYITSSVSNSVRWQNSIPSGINLPVQTFAPTAIQ